MKLLLLMTNASSLTLKDGTAYPSGYWAEEFAIPYRLFKERGYEIDIATVGGIQPSVDKSSLDPDNLRFVRPAGSQIDDAAKAKEWADIIANAPELKKPLAVEKITREQLNEYQGIYMVGGHGCMEDEPKSQAMGQITVWSYELQFPVAAVCHGHSVMLSARDEKGKFPYGGYRMTCFSHNEEKATRIYGNLPLVLEEELRKLGVEYSEAPIIWGAHIVEDRNLITGQNPFSSNLLAEKFLHRIRDLRASALAK
ncbi:MAG: type 1 glutamine amidotransferase domain-containing protein [Prochloraceae cyanobacterium]|nr:type 1 glutamine amidotransferase domain-containing protein [Prochloraceae cyanobacterium]